jgi:hypothetical protein
MTKVIKITQPVIDYSIISPYVHQWVALSKDKKTVVAADSNGKKLMAKINQMESINAKNVVLHYVVDVHETYSF